MTTWLITWVTSEPEQATAIAVALLFAVLAIASAAKIARALTRPLRETADMHADDWHREGGLPR